MPATTLRKKSRTSRSEISAAPSSGSTIDLSERWMSAWRTASPPTVTVMASVVAQRFGSSPTVLTRSMLGGTRVVKEKALEALPAPQAFWAVTRQ